MVITLVVLHLRKSERGRGLFYQTQFHLLKLGLACLIGDFDSFNVLREDCN